MGKFEIDFVYPWKYNRNDRKQIEWIKKYPKEDIRLEQITFSDVALFFDGVLYRPAWNKHLMLRYTDTEYLYSIFKQLINGANIAYSTPEKQLVWFIDDPISIYFRKDADTAVIWVEAGTEISKTTMAWDDFVRECIKKTKKFVQTIVRINKTMVTQAEIKELMKQIGMAEENLARTKAAAGKIGK